MAFISLLFVVVFIIVTMAWGVSLWMRIDENFPIQDFPLRHVLLKIFMICIFFPALILLALVLIASLADKKNT
jgi:TRAP-type C4-dicarboxylate transport system permease small subunit